MTKIIYDKDGKPTFLRSLSEEQKQIPLEWNDGIVDSNRPEIGTIRKFEGEIMAENARSEAEYGRLESIREIEETLDRENDSRDDGIGI